MSDPIDRQAAINKLDPLFESLAIDKIKSLPSAQSEITLCRDCKHFAGEWMYCAHNILVPFSHFYCYYAERGEG